MFRNFICVVFSWSCVFALSTSIGQANLTPVTITSDKCAHIMSNTTSNHNDTTFEVGTFYRAPNQKHGRTFIEFDIASENIPTGAIIESATINITHNGIIYGSNPWRTKLVTSSWGETTVKSNDQPDISDLTGDVSTAYTTVSDTVKLDVKDMVQRMVYEQITNYGWSIQVDNEALTSRSGATFYSDEASNNQPKLVIEYYLPLTLSNVIIVHESSTGAEDASISYTLSNGCSSSYSYQWIDSSGTQISTNDTLSNVGYGWYGLQVSGSDCSDTLYMGFLVGTECEEVTIKYTTRPEYTANAYIYDRVVSGGIDYRDVNYGNSTNFRSDNRFFSPSWVDIKSYMDFNVWMDDAFTVNQADLLLQGWSHSNTGDQNQSEVNEVTSFWNEDLITWNEAPTNNGTADFLVASTSSSTEDATFDMIDLWDDWKLDNNANYGILFQLQDFDDDVDCSQFYHSPNTTTSADRPSWTFQLELNHDNNPIFCNGTEAYPYNELKKQLDGGFGESYDDTLNFSLDEAYKVDTSLYLVTTIYDDTYEVEASCDAAGSTTGGIPALTYDFDDNRYVMDLSGITTLVDGEFYVLEVENTKGDSFFLKFKHNE